MLRRLIGIVALLAVAATPALAQSRLVCRYTGEAVVGCPDDRCPAAPAARDAGCCEQRATAALPAADPVPVRLDPPLLVLAPGPVFLPRSALVHEPRLSHQGRAHGSGPPVLLVTRALLI